MNLDIVRAWKDEDYRSCLSEEDRPVSPVGEIELADSELEAVYGGVQSIALICISNNNCNNGSFICVSNGVCSGGCSGALICI